MSTAKPPLALDAAYSALVARLDPAGRMERFVRLGGGISAETSALEWRDASGALHTVVVRRVGKRDGYGDDLSADEQSTLLRALYERGLPVPEPLLVDASRKVFAEPLLVLRHVPGEPDLLPRDRSAFARTLARQLADIHQKARDALDGCRFLPLAIDFFNAVQARTFECPAGFPQRAIREALARVWPLTPRNPECLLHGDYWAGNLVWNDGALAGVIDWADALIGEPLADLAIARLELSWLLDFAAVDTFTDAYLAASGCDSSQLPFWDLLATLRPGSNLARWASAWPVLGRPDITERMMSDARDAFATRALEKI